MKSQPAVSLAERHGLRWTEHEDEQLITMVKEGNRLAHMADVLNRTEGGVLGRMEYLAQVIHRFKAAKELIVEYHK